MIVLSVAEQTQNFSFLLKFLSSEVTVRFSVFSFLLSLWELNERLCAAHLYFHMVCGEIRDLRLALCCSSLDSHDAL